MEIGPKLSEIRISCIFYYLLPSYGGRHRTDSFFTPEALKDAVHSQASSLSWTVPHPTQYIKLDAIAVPNPTQYTKLDKYVVEMQKPRLVRSWSEYDFFVFLCFCNLCMCPSLHGFLLHSQGFEGCSLQPRPKKGQ